MGFFLTTFYQYFSCFFLFFAVFRGSPQLLRRFCVSPRLFFLDFPTTFKTSFYFPTTLEHFDTLKNLPFFPVLKFFSPQLCVNFTTSPQLKNQFFSPTCKNSSPTSFTFPSTSLLFFMSRAYFYASPQLLMTVLNF